MQADTASDVSRALQTGRPDSLSSWPLTAPRPSRQTRHSREMLPDLAFQQQQQQQQHHQHQHQHQHQASQTSSRPLHGSLREPPPALTGIAAWDLPRNAQRCSQRTLRSNSRDSQHSVAAASASGVASGVALPALVTNDQNEAYYPLSPAPPPSDHRASNGSRSKLSPLGGGRSSLTVDSISLATASGADGQVDGDGDTAHANVDGRAVVVGRSSHAATTASPARTYLKPRHFATDLPSGPPSIYWSDDGTSNSSSSSSSNANAADAGATVPNAAAYTFYRGPGDDDDDDDDEGDTDRNDRQTGHAHRSGGSAGAGGSSSSHAHLQPGGGGTNHSGSIAGPSQNWGEAGRTQKSNTNTDTARDGRRVRQDQHTSKHHHNNNDSDGDDENDNDDNVNEAEFEFVNGRYVPPGLRDGRAPGRRPLGTYGTTSSSTGDGGKQEPSAESIRRSRQSFSIIALLVLFVVVAGAVGVGVGVGLSLTK